MKSLLETRNEYWRPESLRELITIILYELGDFTKCVVYAESRYMHLKDAYMAEARIALADMITQTRLLTEAIGADWDELWRDGEERFRERMIELKAKKEKNILT